jgi:thioredoxin 1
MENYTTEQVKEMIASGKKVVVDFKAEWCAPCKSFLPIFEKFSKNENFKDIVFIKIDVDKNSELPIEYGIRSIPTVILFENGQIKTKKTGFMSENDFQIFLS